MWVDVARHTEREDGKREVWPGTVGGRDAVRMVRDNGGKVWLGGGGKRSRGEGRHHLERDGWGVWVGENGFEGELVRWGV